MSQLIDLDGGFRKFIDPPALITADHDISADSIEVGLGGYVTGPGQWLADSDPAVLVTRPSADQIQVTVLVGDTIRPASGSFWLWARLTDSPEIVGGPFRQTRVIVVNTGTITYP
jgi:hypothetical protein